MRLKWILGAIALLVVAAVVAAVAILSGYDFNQFKPRIIKVAHEATGRRLTLAGNIDLEIGLTPSLVVEGVALENAPWGSRPDMLTVKRFEVQVRILPLLRGNIEVKRMLAVEPVILVETNAAGESNLSFSGKQTVEPEKKVEETGPSFPALAFRDVRIEKGRFTYQDGPSGKTAEVMLHDLTASTEGMGEPLQITLSGSYGDLGFQLSGSLGRMDAIGEPDEPWPLDLTAKVAGLSAHLKGHVRDVFKGQGIDVNIRVEGESTKGLAGLIGSTGIPDVGPLQLTLSLKDAAPGAYRLSDIHGTFGDSDLRGSASMDMGGKRPRLGVALESRRLDLRPLLSGAKDAAPAAHQKKKKRAKVFPAQPLPLEDLRLVDGDIGLKVKDLYTPKLALHDLQLDVVMDKGRLRTKAMKAMAGGGQVSGRLSLESQGEIPALSTQVTVRKMDLGRMLKELDMGEMIEGEIDGEVQAQGKGISIAAIMAGLDGKTVLVMGHGRINNETIGFLGGDIRSGLFRLLSPFEQKRDYTHVNCVVSRFDILNGIAETTAMVIDTDVMSVVGQGTINLGTEAINLGLKPSPKEGVSTGGGTKLSFSLTELAKPLRLGGTLANPSLTVDPTQTAIAVGKTVGGMALFGPAGILAALAGESSEGENPCLAALEAAEKGVKMKDTKKGKARNVLEKAADGVSGTLKKLFGQ